MKTPTGRFIEIDPSDVQTRKGWGYTLVPDPDHDDGFHEGIGPENQSRSYNEYGVPDANMDMDDEIVAHKKKAKKKKAKKGGSK